MALNATPRFIAILLTLAVATPASAQVTFTVDNTADVNDATPGDGLCVATGGGCTLRAAITEANALVGADTVDVPAGTYALTLSGTNEEQNVSGDLDVRSDLTIRSSGAGAVITAAGLTSQRVMDVPVLANVTLRHLTLTGALLTGTTSTSAGAGLRAMAGAVVNVEDCVITANTTADEGAGIYATGVGTTVNVLRSVISDNTINGATGFGGGLRTALSASLTIIETTVSGNTSTAAGGGLNHGTSTGTVLIERSLFTNNTAISQNTGGGAASCGGPCRIVNSTFTGNQVIHDTPGTNQGGGAFWISPLIAAVVIDIEASTIAGNSAPHTGGGIRRQGASGSLNLRGTIVADNDLVSDTTTARVDLFGNINLAGFNLIEDSTGYNGTETTDPGTNVLGVDPLLDVLADNGGPTLTRALLTGSPAIDAGTCTLIAGGTLDVDQRGEPRVPPCDIGAFEFDGTIVATEDAPGAGAIALSTPRPNPSAGDVTLSLRVDRTREVVVTLHDMLGRQVAILYDGMAASSVPVVLRIPGAGLPGGVYLVRASGAGDVATARVTLMR